jgi:hypothetical protein
MYDNRVAPMKKKESTLGNPLRIAWKAKLPYTGPFTSAKKERLLIGRLDPN